MHAWTRSGMLLMLVRIAAIGISSHFFFITVIKTSWTTFSFHDTLALIFFSTWHLSKAQIFSMGLRSRLYEDHGNTCTEAGCWDLLLHLWMYVLGCYLAEISTVFLCFVVAFLYSHWEFFSKDVSLYLSEWVESDLPLHADRSPDMQLERMLHHWSYRHLILWPCQAGILEHLKCCFIRENNIFPGIFLVIFCLS